MFITFEGIEGAGKSTQVARLVERLRAAGYAARPTREPGGTPLADAIRALLLHPDGSLEALRAATLAKDGEPAETILPMTEALLLSAARAQHVARIRGWLAGGEIVVCDRFADATRAYQGAARGENMDAIVTLEQLATGGLRPDLTILLDLAPTKGQQRKQQAHAAGEDLNRLDQEDPAFHARVRAGYLELAAAEPQRWVVLDADQPPEALAERIWQAVRDRFFPVRG
jgi:dTMP kinase